jgi:hypothetical protein
LSRPHHNGALYCIFEFAHVAGPFVGLQKLLRLG